MLNILNLEGLFDLLAHVVGDEVHDQSHSSVAHILIHFPPKG